jgi:hypothetical protein
MPTVVPHTSDSAAQRSAEVIMIEGLGEQLGVPLSPRTIRLDDGTRVELDGASSDLSVLVECSARFGPPRGAQPKKIYTDALKLSWIATYLEPRPSRLILLFADPVASRPFSGSRGWGARAIADAGIEVLHVELPPEMAAAIRDAQTAQYR